MAQAASVWPDFIKTIASVLALPLAGSTFWLGYRQKEKERTRAYYHKVVVDVVLQPILDTITVQIENLREAGIQAQNGMTSTRKTLPRSCSIALSEFAEGLFRLQDAIVERTMIFDEGLSEKIRIDFQSIQDDITQWFNDVNLSKRRNVEELEQILRKAQRNVIKRLYRGDF